MANHLPAIVANGFAMLWLVAVPAAAQPDSANFRFNSGQPVQPIYEGWQRTADGTIEMYFGYINRNYAEVLSIPVGTGNAFSPGPSDRGQPTVFHTRIHRQQFSVKLPATWGRREELTWTVAANGRTLKAVGWLQPEWEIDAETGGQMQNEEALKNKRPALTVEAPAAGAVLQPLTLTAIVTDDGLPKARGPRKPIAGADSPPTLRPNPNDPEILVNTPGTSEGRGGEGRRAPGRGQVVWTVWRGPADAAFAPPAATVQEGRATVAATFSKPGTYVLRALTNDGALSSAVQEVTLVVTP
jgi:hypothetical protein